MQIELNHPAPGTTTAPSELTRPSWLEYEAKKLDFGTSGLRDDVSNMTDLEVYTNTLGCIRYLEAAGELERQGEAIALARDLREKDPNTGLSSSPRIAWAVAKAIEDAGYKVVNYGKVPTPTLAYEALRRGQIGVMVTGSHIPGHMNGIKFYKRAGEVLKADERGIKDAVAEVRQVEYSKSSDETAFNSQGILKGSDPTRDPGLDQCYPVDESASRSYVRRYLDLFPGEKPLEGKKILFYTHSAVGRDLILEILRKLGADVIEIERSEDTFIPIDTEAIDPRYLKKFKDWAGETDDLFAIVSTDGDSDRPFVVDENGIFHRGDVLGAVVSDYLKAQYAAVPISANDGVDQHLAERAIKHEKTKIGSPHVIKAMDDAITQGQEKVVSWEVNGGFLTGTDFTINGNTLPPLATRDAFLPILAALLLAIERNVPVSQPLTEAAHNRFTQAGRIKNFPRAVGQSLVKGFSPKDASIQEVDFSQPGQVTIQLADESTRTLPESDTQAQELLNIRGQLQNYFTPQEGFGPILRINYIDGVRIYFGNETRDVVHMRPSGNANELRNYAVSNSQERADGIVEAALGEPKGVYRKMERAGSIRRNIELTNVLIRDGKAPEVIGIVSGSSSAQSFWQQILDKTKAAFKANQGISFHEDLPVNQAFGILLMWQRFGERLKAGQGALTAFVFGSGSRSTPLTETDNAQKPAIGTFAEVEMEDSSRRYLSMVELAMQYFIPVQQYLKRSGFDGLVVKWGDEVQIPVLDISGTDPLFENADIVRFVSVREMNQDEAKNKDWVGVDENGYVTAFIPRRPLAEMEKLADRGLVQRKDGKLYCGINLGSIAVSRALLDLLLEEFSTEVNREPQAGEKWKDIYDTRPTLDPEFFTALTIAVINAPTVREQAWQQAIQESEDVKNLSKNMPNVLDRLRRVVETFEQRRNRTLKMVAMDFIDQYWGDIGQHPKIYDFYMALNDGGPEGEIVRAIANIPSHRDENGNIIVGENSVAPGVTVKNSVLINAKITGAGSVEDSVLIGTRTGDIQAKQAYDFGSKVPALTLDPRSGTYKVIRESPVHARLRMRLTTLFMPTYGTHLMKVYEGTDLRNTEVTYNVPILGNAVSFKQAHEDMGKMTIEQLKQVREKKEKEVLAIISYRTNLTPMVISPGIQHYDWGNLEYIPALLRIDNTENKPYAELWIGAHPGQPAKAAVTDIELNLNDLISGAAEEILGKEVCEAFGRQLPFLLKVLSAGKPLSIQAHPNKVQAEEGFDRENKQGFGLKASNRNYKDDNHKPELIAALTDFYALNGFRPLDEIGQVLVETPEFRQIMPEFQLTRDDVIALYTKLMTMPQEEIDTILRSLIDRLRAENERAPFTREQREYWVLRADEEFSKEGHKDRGLFSIYLLNLIHLQPGEAMYLQAGELHAYLEGTGMEDMANSDNVLRGGLTPKHVDVPELLKNLSFNSGRPEILTPQPSSATEKAYQTPVREFELSEIDVTAEQSHTSGSRYTVDLLLLMEGKVTIQTQSGAIGLEQGKGQVAMIPAMVGKYAITGTGRLYRSTVPKVPPSVLRA
jgi:phosphomannomutase